MTTVSRWFRTSDGQRDPRAAVRAVLHPELTALLGLAGGEPLDRRERQSRLDDVLLGPEGRCRVDHGRERQDQTGDRQAPAFRDGRGRRRGPESESRIILLVSNAMRAARRRSTAKPRRGKKSASPARSPSSRSRKHRSVARFDLRESGASRASAPGPAALVLVQPSSAGCRKPLRHCHSGPPRRMRGTCVRSHHRVATSKASDVATVSSELAPGIADGAAARSSCRGAPKTVQWCTRTCAVERPRNAGLTVSVRKLRGVLRGIPVAPLGTRRRRQRKARSGTRGTGPSG